MRVTSRRGFTLAEVAIATCIASVFIGMVAMTIKMSVSTRNQRADQLAAVLEAREVMETCERLLNRAVEVREWDPTGPWWTNGTPSLSDATGEIGDAYMVSANAPGGGTWLNLGSGWTQYFPGQLIVHDGVRWTLPNQANPRKKVGTWNQALDTPLIRNGTGTVGDWYEVNVTQTALPGSLALPGQPVAPTGGWIKGDRIVCDPFRIWRPASWRFSNNSPGLADTLTPVLNVYHVNQGGTRNLGSGNLTVAVGEYLIKYGTNPWSNGCKTALRNFKSKNPLSQADDNVDGIHFYADVDPDSVASDVNNGCKLLEWVWIWWDSALDYDQTLRPFERRGPVKVAIFRADPYGPTGDTHDLWTRPTHAFFQGVNNPTSTSRKAYFTTAANFGNLEFKVQEFLAPTSSGPVVRKRVAITGGVFLDRTKEMAAQPNPWIEVAPGSRYLTPSARWVTTPSYTFSRSIYPKNLNACQDPQGRLFDFQNSTTRYNRVRRRSVSWSTQFTTTNIKLDHVVQPR